MTTLLAADTDDAARDHGLFWRILAVSMAAKLVFAWFLPMGVDEAYATAVAREFSWSFFDHPPLGFWSPVVAANLTGIEHPFIYRLPTLLYGLATSFLMFEIGRQLGGSRAGVWTVLLYAISPAFAFAGGTFVLPDGPLDLGAAVAVLALVRITKSDGSAALWLLAGAGLAVALASKYQAGLLPVSAFVFAIIHPVGRRWFASPWPYVAVLVALIGLLPILLWNIQTDWASFRFHSGRTGNGLQPDNLALMVLGQLLYLLPPVAVVAAVGLRTGLRAGAPERLLVAIIALLPILGFNLLYLFSNKSFPHWTFPGWQFALPLAGVWLASANGTVLRRVWRWLIGVGGLVWILLLLVLVQVNTGYLTRPFAKQPSWDRTENVFDYSALGPILRDRGDLDGIQAIAVENWIAGGLISTGLGGEFPIQVLRGNKHHFAFMSGENRTGPALLLVADPLDRGERRQKALLRLARKTDPNASALQPVVLIRGNQPYVRVSVIRIDLEP